jgi:pyruvate,water dikinase
VTTPPGDFRAPGPGSWELEAAHFTRPITHFVRGPFIRGFARGFAESSARYGVLLSHFKGAAVNDFLYIQPVPFGAPEGAKGPPPKLVFQAITRLVPKLRNRIRTGHEAIASRRWRDDLRRWDDEIKPAAIRAHLALQAFEVGKATDEQLAAHVIACGEHLEAMIAQHHQFTITCSLPVGDYLAHALEWTRRPAGELLGLLKGSSPISRGFAATELEDLAHALRTDSPDSRRTLECPEAPAYETLSLLRARPGAVGEAARAYLDVIQLRSLGYDVSDKCAGELPDVLLRTIRVATEQASEASETSKTGETSKSGKTSDAGETAKQLATLRDLVPAAHRAQFDGLLEEARVINRLRDERAHYTDGWAIGLARRAILEAGARLKRAGRLHDVEDATGVTAPELAALLRGGTAPTADELRAREKARATRTTDDAPPFLGAPPSPPPPAAWLPPKGRRTARAIDAFLGAIFDTHEPDPKAAATPRRSVRGLPVSPGIYEGIARIIATESDFGRIQQGDVLVTRATSPYFNVVLPLLGAIVTDRGGQLTHAAIVAREYGIPAVVGTRDATRVIVDGDRVRVDGSAGIVDVVP